MPEMIDQSRDRKIKEIKTILRSLLIAKGSRDVTIRQLNGLYKETEGANIPFRDFGYSSLEEFLRKIPDTLRLHYNRDNELCVYHIDTENSMHVSSLVSRQKKPPRKAKPSRLIYNSSKSAHTNYRSVQSTRPVEHCSKPNPFNILRQVLQEFKDSSIRLTNNCGIHKTQVLSEITKRLPRYVIYTLHSLNLDLHNFHKMLDVKDDYIYFKDKVVQSTSTPNAQVQKSVISEVDVTTIQKTNDLCQNSSKGSKDKYNEDENIQMSELSSSYPKSNPFIPQRTKFRLLKLIENHSEGIWCSELPTLYKREYNTDLEYNEIGFNSITEFVAALPDIFLLVEPPHAKRQMVMNAHQSTETNHSNCKKKTMASLYNFDDYAAVDPEPIPTTLVY